MKSLTNTTLPKSEPIPNSLKKFLVNLVAACCLVVPAHAGLVTSAADDGSPGTLRAEMAAALSGDTITFDPGLEGQTIALTRGQLVIDKNLTITGLGQNELAISGNHATRVFLINNSSVTAMIQGLTIRDGYAQDLGGGIYNSGALTLSHCTLAGNSTDGYTGGGGGIYNSGTLTLSDSTLSSNSSRAFGGNGGAIKNSGTVTVTHSTLSDNFARAGGGGGIYNTGTLTLSDSTLSGNSAGFFGGGIYTQGIVTINHCTLWANSSGDLYHGGGIYNAHLVNIKNSIVGNSRYGGDYYGYFDPYQWQTVSINVSGVNFDTDGTCPGFTHVTAAQLNLAPLADLGGPTMTHALLPGSVAIDAVTSCTGWLGNPIDDDQRGVARPQGVACDVGSFEALPQIDSPAAADDSYSLLENGTLNVPAPGVLNNDSHPPGLPLIVAGTTGPAHGNLAINVDGSFTYTPYQYFRGSDSFGYVVTDGQYGAALAIVSITVIEVNQPPAANAQTIGTFQNHAINLTLSGSDPHGDQLSFVVLSQPSHGTLSGTLPALTYTPTPYYTGSDSFTFKATDGALDSEPAVVSIQVAPDVPIAAPQTISTFLNHSVNITLGGSDPARDQLSFVVLSQPSHGTLSGTPPGLIYTPVPYYTGPDSFTFKATDAFFDSESAVISIYAKPDVLTANPQTVGTCNNSSVTIALTGSDADGDPVSSVLLSSPSHGTLSGTAPNLTYTPQANYNGDDSFTFKVSDGEFDSPPATVLIQACSVWTDPIITFSVPDNVDLQDPAYQDQLIPGVTLASDWSLFYNAATETYSDLDRSPADTEWAFGTTADLSSLAFQPFPQWCNWDPSSVVGANAVLHLISENIYLDIKITSWSWSGGFSYQRTTPLVRVMLNGAEHLSLLAGGTFIDHGATAVDLNGNPLEVTVTGNLDMRTAGMYALIYTATDSEGHIGRAHRIVDLHSIIVDVYSGFTRASGGAPYSGFVGSFLADSVEFARQSYYGWTPFRRDTFGADIWGTLDAEAPALYSFSLDSDDGSVLYIDGNLVVENGGDHPPRTMGGSVNLTAGRHCFEIQFYNSGGDSGVNLNLPAGVSYACPVNTLSDVIVSSDPGLCGANMPFALPRLVESCFGLTVTCSPAPGSFFPVGSTPVICTATDGPGNVLAQSSFNVIVKDNQAPSVVSYPTDRTIECPATPVFGTPQFSDLCDNNLRITSADTSLSVSGKEVSKTRRTWTARDAAGNNVSCSQTITVVDTTAPTISCPANLTVITTSASGGTVNYPAATAGDNCATPAITYSKASGSVFGLGTTSVTVTATDAKGNSSMCAFDVRVVYSWSGVLQPVNADGTSVFKAGTTVPVKFQLTGASAGISNAVARLSYTKVSNNLPGPVNEADAPGNATTGNLFQYNATTGQYVFNWSTKGLTAGTYQLTVDLGDGVTRSLNASLK